MTTNAPGPSHLTFTIYHQPELSCGELALRLFKAFEISGFGEPCGWSTDADEMHAAAPDEILTVLWNLDASCHFFRIDIIGGRHWVCSRGEVWETQIFLFTDERPYDPRWLFAALEMVRAMLPDAQFMEATVFRTGSTGFLPSPPLLREYHLVVTSEAEVAGVYGDTERYWQCWDEVIRHGKHRLVYRAFDAVDDAKWLESVYEDQMEMARRAPPGRTAYAQMTLKEWNRPVLEAEESALSYVGYHPEKRLIEFTAWIDGNRHIPLREIIMVGTIIAKGKDPKGRPVEAVRVVFVDEASARRECRPLKDVDALVCFHDPDGNLVEVVD